MALKFWQTTRFKELQKKWNEELAASGFKDAEILINGRPRLRQRANNSYRGAPLLIRQNKLRYYELLGLRYHKQVFECPIEALVMARRSQGVTIRKICKELAELGKSRHRQTIRRIIVKYEKLWGLSHRRRVTR